MRRMLRLAVVALCLIFALVTVGQLAAAEKQEKMDKSQTEKQEKKGMTEKQGSTDKMKMESFSGKVTAVDPKAIVLESGQGKGALTVGAIVTTDTVLMVKGKKASINDLTKEIKPGDTVKLKIERTTDLYAKEISK